MATPTAPPAEEIGASSPVPVLRRLAAALHYRDFRILWIGAFTSSIGTWMQRVTQSWLVLMIADMVGSTLWDASDESKSGPIGLSVRRLFTSTYVEAGADISRLTHPHGDFVESPFTPRSLLSKVREVLDRDPR